MERVYVANLPPDIRIKDIDDFFRPFGKLVYIDVNHRANPVYASVQFDSPRNAFNAVKARHGYDYEGYTLQLRLAENEVRKRRDATPPPPAPIFNNNYERQNINNGFNNNYSGNRMTQNSQWSNNNRSDMRLQNMDFSSNNRSNMQQLNMMPYSSGNRPNMEQQFSNNSRSNMQQQFSNTTRSNMQQQFSNTTRSNMQQQYSNFNRSNMMQMNNFDNRPDTAQQNMMPYSSSGPSNTGRSNIPQLQNINVQFPNNSWDTRGNSNGWNTGSFGNDNFGNNINNSYDNAGANAAYNPNNDPYSNQGYEDKFTIGLSGSGRKWFNRYISKGFSPEVARAKALEHRKVPYLRGDPVSKSIPNDPRNVALETIGNTIISILSSNPGDNIQPGITNNMGRNKIHKPSTSSMAPQANAVSKRQYLNSLDKLKMFKSKSRKSGKDLISIKYHTQIVKDYKEFNKVASRNDSRTSGGDTSSRSRSAREEIPRRSNRPRTEQQISELMIKQKAKLLRKARELGSETRKHKRFGGAYKKRTKILMDHGFLEMEAKSLAWNDLNALEELLSLKREYDILAKKTVFMPASKASLANAPKSVVYRNDLQYLEEYAKHRIKGLSKTILRGLSDCLKRIHDYEKREKLPLTETKFTKLLVKITSREGFFKNAKKSAARKRKSERSAGEKKDVKESKTPESGEKVDNVNNQEDNQDNEENEDDENQQDGDQDNEEYQDEENPDNEENQFNGEDDKNSEPEEDNNPDESAGVEE